MKTTACSRKLLVACVVTCLAMVAVPALATFSAFSDSDFSYIGTVTDPGGTVHSLIPYTSTPGTTTYDGRDASLNVGNEPSQIDTTAFQANWYAAAPDPNNTPSGFVSLYDPASSSVTSISGGWTDNTYTTFTFAISGGPTYNPTSGNNLLWPAPYTTGAFATAYGEFQNYTLYLTATFAPGDVTEEAPGWWSTTAAPLTLTGGFNGTFLNSGSLQPGLYAFDFTFANGINWAGANGHYTDPYFGASAVSASVPEPPDLALFGLSALGLVVLGRRRRRAMRRIG